MENAPSAELLRYAANFRRLCQGHLRRWSLLSLASQRHTCILLAKSIALFGPAFAKDVMGSRAIRDQLFGSVETLLEANQLALFSLLNKLIQFCHQEVAAEAKEMLVHYLIVDEQNSEAVRLAVYDCLISLLQYAASVDVAFTSVICRLANEESPLSSPELQNKVRHLTSLVGQHVRRAADPFYKPFQPPAVLSGVSESAQEEAPFHAPQVAKRKHDEMSEVPISEAPLSPKMSVREAPSSPTKKAMVAPAPVASHFTMQPQSVPPLVEPIPQAVPPPKAKENLPGEPSEANSEEDEEMNVDDLVLNDIAPETDEE